MTDGQPSTREKSISQPKVLLIVPAYNEDETIVTVAATIRQAGYDFIVVNDGSQDSTLETCRREDIPVLDLCSNLGIGGAVQCGHSTATISTSNSTATASMTYATYRLSSMPFKTEPTLS